MKKKHIIKINIQDEDFERKLNKELQKPDVYLKVWWSEGGPLKFHKVNWKIKGGEWNAAFAETFNSTSGYHSIEIGSFPADTSLTLSCRFEAFADIPRILLAVVQGSPGSILKNEPLTGYKTLANGDNWEPKLEADTI